MGSQIRKLHIEFVTFSFRFFNFLDGHNVYVGFCTSQLSPNDLHLGSAPGTFFALFILILIGSWGIKGGDGCFYRTGNIVPYYQDPEYRGHTAISPVKNGDVIGILLDIDKLNVRFYQNGVAMEKIIEVPGIKGF